MTKNTHVSFWLESDPDDQLAAIDAGLREADAEVRIIRTSPTMPNLTALVRKTEPHPTDESF